MNLQPENIDNLQVEAPVAPTAVPVAQKPTSSHTVIERPARVLLGWLTEQEAQACQSCGGTRVPTQEETQRAAQARKTVAARTIGIDYTDSIIDPPAELQDHIHQLQALPAAAGMFTENWRVAIVDLTKVCSLQQSVFIDHAQRRTADLDAADLASVAAVTLPVAIEESKLPLQFDSARQAWMISSANPNLRIAGNWSGELQPGVVGIGFAIRLTPSFLQVARFQGRLLLRDGYHRAYGLLQQGITKVPVFFREFANFEQLGFPAGLLSQEVYMGERPPMLQDYFDETVAAQMPLPAVQKLIVISGLELTPLA